MPPRRTGKPLIPVVDVEKPVYRVLQVFSALGIGGAEKWLLALLRHLKSIEADLPFKLHFDVILTGGERDILDEAAIEYGARLFYVRYSSRRLFRFSRALRTLLKHNSYCAIHNHQAFASGLHFLLGAGCLPPIRIVHIHNPLYDLDEHATAKSRKIIQLEKLLIGRLATHVTATSRQMIGDYGFDTARFQRLKRYPLYCGFEVSEFLIDYETAHAKICDEFGWPLDCKILLFAGRLGSDTYNPGGNAESRKNPSFAIELAKFAIHKNHKIRLLLAGEGRATRQTLENLVHHWGLSDSVRFIGARSDIPNLMAGSDLFLFPSIAEGLGMVAVEAQAAGLRVMASDTVPSECAVLPQLVEFRGLGEGPEAWAEGALRLALSPRPNLHDCNRAIRNSAFSIENSSLRLLELYTGISLQPGTSGFVQN